MELKEILRNSKVTEHEVQEVLKTIREVEELGATRSEYNLATPFSRTSVVARESCTSERTESLKAQR